MKTRRLLSILLIFLVALGTLAVTKPALAEKQKTHVQYDVDMNGTWVQLATDPENPCTIDLTYTDHGFVQVNQWFDEAGNILKEMDMYGPFHRSISGNNGNVINVQQYGPAFFDFVYGESIITVFVKGTGEQQMITIPGIGRISGGAGNNIMAYVFDTDWNFLYTYVVRPDDFLDFSNWDIVCGYLGGAAK